MAQILKLRSTFSRPADNTAYAAGDEISNSASAGSVVRATFNLQGFTRGRITGAAIDITPASASLVITALDLELQIYRTTDVPAAVGDNVTNPIAAATQAKAIGHYRFDDGGWVNELGALTAGSSGIQEVPATMSVGLATPELQRQHVPGHYFDFAGNALPTVSTATGRELTAVLRALGAWTPTGIINAFGITLLIEAE